MGFKNITIQTDKHDAIRKTIGSKSFNVVLEGKLVESERLKKFASKIKIIPETVRIYT